MNQEFRSHPVLVNYEASRDGIVRHCKHKRPVGWISNMGYLLFSAGKKTYHIHRIVYEAFYGLIKDGLVIDHIDSYPLNNKLENLQAISQRENSKKGLTGKHSKHPKMVKSVDTETKEEEVFHSMSAAGNHFDICIPSVRKVAEGITKSAISKKTGHRIKFSYHPLMDDSD